MRIVYNYFAKACPTFMNKNLIYNPDKLLL